TLVTRPPTREPRITCWTSTTPGRRSSLGEPKGQKKPSPAALAARRSVTARTFFQAIAWPSTPRKTEFCCATASASHRRAYILRIYFAGIYTKSSNFEIFFTKSSGARCPLGEVLLSGAGQEISSRPRLFLFLPGSGQFREEIAEGVGEQFG